MHDYATNVIANIHSGERTGVSGYLRVKAGADRENVIKYLTEERDAASQAVDHSTAPTRLLGLSEPMQILILAELLLRSPDAPVNLRAVAAAQGYGTGYVSERIEDAADALLMLAPRDTLERVPEV